MSEYEYSEDSDTKYSDTDSSAFSEYSDGEFERNEDLIKTLEEKRFHHEKLIEENKNTLNNETNKQTEIINKTNNIKKENEMLRIRMQNLKDPYMNVCCAKTKVEDSIKWTETRIKELEQEKSSLIETMKIRAELKGILNTNLDNDRTKHYNNLISQKLTNLDELKRQASDLENKKIEYLKHNDTMRNNEWILSELQKNLDESKQIVVQLEAKRIELGKTLYTLRQLTFEEINRPKYMNYATGHKIKYDENDDTDLFRQCNKHHHWRLHEGYIIDAMCYRHRNYERDPDIFDQDCNSYGEATLHCTLDEDDNYSAEGTCACGYCEGELIYVDPVDDILHFNLRSKKIYSFMGNKYAE